MNIKDFIKNLVVRNTEEPHFGMVADSDGLNFFLAPDIFEKCSTGDANGLLLHQYVCLQMLEEQGYVESIPHGYIIPSEHAVVLENEVKLLLGFPPPYPGLFRVRVHGQTTQNDFFIKIILVLPDGVELPHYELNGPCLELSSQELFMLSSAEWLAFNALREHHNLPLGNRSERLNLKLVGSLQAAKKLGMNIDLSHFNKINVYEPDKIGISVTEQENGTILLTPAFGTGDSPDEVRRRLGQLNNKDACEVNDVGEIGVIRVRDQIVILDEKRLKATHEIISNRVIPQSQVKRFLETPTAFLDANLVDLDVGFSFRVRGATEFKHSYFGETDKSALGWFEQAGQKDNVVSFPGALHEVVKTEEDLQSVVKQIEDARSTGATVVDFSGKTIDISDGEAVDNILKSIQKKIAALPCDCLEPEIAIAIENDEVSPVVVVDIKQNDDELDYGFESIPVFIKDVSYKGPIDFSGYKRQPYTHQEEGIRWLLGLAQPSLENDKIAVNNEADKITHGALLADDMGLGKTYMALIAIAEYYRQCREKNIVERPVLIVVPLTLLENWKDEIEQTFLKKPFADIVLLQTDAQLKKFRLEGSGIEIRQKVDPEKLQDYDHLLIPENAIKYSLKIGKEFGLDKLDIPRRAVITTYQTLRDYQFSLCRVDWSFVIFDEAQHIKNPNTLATRAAKGLKAQFKLLATGTPVENHLGDFWCLVDTAKPAALKEYQDFRKKYIIPLRQADPGEITQKRLKIGKELREKVGPYMLRRLKEDNLPGLPLKYIYSGVEASGGNGFHYDPHLGVEMREEQLQRYDTAINTVLEIQQQEGGGNPVLAGLNQLREISLHPLLLNKGVLPTPINASEARSLFKLSGKLEILLTILDKVSDRNEKAIIFLVNKRLQSFLKIALGRIYNITVDIVNGDTKAIVKSRENAHKTRKGIIDAFESRAGFGVIIMSPIAAGTGITVVAANNVIHLERHWNPAKENQATDRVYRIGQTNDVNVYIPILKHPAIDSFDVNLHKLLSSKIMLKDAVITPEEVSSEEMGQANFRSSVNPGVNQELSLKGSDLNFLSWEEFEALCAEVYGLYFEADAFLTPTSDNGADVVIMGKTNVLIQCKHTANSNYCSTEPMIQIHGAKPAYEEKTGKSFST
ncbi:MAG: DEAD/DEAH box helicase family protein, partial [Deltaproteobacteria bacterium]|nr:DEAD/DEAH box helicase family protein [Deltaproteobacteria bacterium]